MFVMETIEDLWEHIAYTLAYAPDFPKEDFLPEDQQMSLDRAFEQLRQGVSVAYPEDGSAAKRTILLDLLDKSFQAYSEGDELTAGRLLNSFQGSIFASEA